jgi:hypothetical protein
MTPALRKWSFGVPYAVQTDVNKGLTRLRKGLKLGFRM